MSEPTLINAFVPSGFFAACTPLLPFQETFSASGWNQFAECATFDILRALSENESTV